MMTDQPLREFRVEIETTRAPYWLLHYETVRLEAAGIRSAEALVRDHALNAGVKGLRIIKTTEVRGA